MVSEKKIFKFDEARVLLPEVRRLTDEAHARIEALQSAADPEGRLSVAQTRLEAIVSDWAQALNALGIEVKGLWLADFDNGSGYYCWQYPEEGLDYYHSYEEGFRGRMRIH